MMKRKNKVLIGTLLGSTTFITSLGIIQGVKTDASNAHKFKIDGNWKVFLDNDEADLTHALPNTYDGDLPRKPKPKPTLPPKPIEKPVPIVEVPIIKDPEKPTLPKEPEKIENPAPIPQPEPPKPITSPKEPEIIVKPEPLKEEIKPEVVPQPSPPAVEIPDEPAKPEPPKEEKPKEIRERKEIVKDDIRYYADVVTFPPRTDKKSDVEKGITNRVPYRAEITPDIENVTGALTEANIKASIKRAQRHGKSNDWVFSPGSSYREILESDTDVERKVNYFNNQGSSGEQLESLYSRYWQLLKNKELLRSYQDEIGTKNFDKWWNDTREFSWLPPRAYERRTIPLGHLLLLMHIDHNKITKISGNIKEWLAKGYVIPKDYASTSVNANGEWEVHNFEPPNNPTVDRIVRDNKRKRVLGNNDKWSRSAEDIERGKFANWEDRDVTDFYRTHGFNDLLKYRGGIYVTEYKRKEKIEGVDRDKAIVVTIDVLVPNAYEKAKAVIERFKEKNIEITGYRIKNIGKRGYDQIMDQIFAALPDKLPMLELFFESKNTSSLKYLKNKEIDELSMLSNNKVGSLDDDWAFNPWALNKVAWINMADYNVSSEYNPNDTIYTRITFDNLAFDPEDYKPGDLSIINNGLRMAYWVRNNERIFQGGWGSGNKPDREPQGNSYPMGLDFSRTPQIKSLRGLVFNHEDHPNNYRKLNKLKFFNDSKTFTLPTTDINEAQFKEILITTKPQMPKTKIMFSNGKETKNIKIVPTRLHNSINGSGLANLRVLIEYSDGNFDTNTKIIVPVGANKLFNDLRGAGFKVEYESEEDEGIII